MRRCSPRTAPRVRSCPRLLLTAMQNDRNSCVPCPHTARPNETKKKKRETYDVAHITAPPAFTWHTHLGFVMMQPQPAPTHPVLQRGQHWRAGAR